MTPAPAALVAAVRSGALGLDAAVAVRVRQAPPPPWWPFPPDGDLAAYFPQVGHPSGGDDGRPEADTVITTRPKGRPALASQADILAATYPGDSIQEVADRLGISGSNIRQARVKHPEFKRQMDIRRGRGAA